MLLLLNHSLRMLLPMLFHLFVLSILSSHAFISIPLKQRPSFFIGNKPRIRHTTPPQRLLSSQQSPHTVGSLSSFQTNSPLTNQINNLNSSQNPNVKGAVLTPQQILHPSFPFTSCIELPLHAAKHSIRQSLLHLRDNWDPSSNTNDEKSSTTTIRIEQRLSETIDILDWLRNIIPTDGTEKVYFANAEHSMEAGGYGRGAVFSGPGELTDREWKVISSFPPQTRVYGGGRFDVNRTFGTEWDDFGGHFYVLPSVELRTEGEGNDNQTTTTTTTTTLAVNLHFDREVTIPFREVIHSALDQLENCPEDILTSSPPPTLPSVLYRDSNAGLEEEQEIIWEKGINSAFECFSDDDNNMTKVVLARRTDLHVYGEIRCLDVLKRMKDSGHVGHFFYLERNFKAFLGCTPERLFRVEKGGKVKSEALAGTRPRGTSASADASLLRELFSSSKDMSENDITMKFIIEEFQRLERNGSLRSTEIDPKPFVRRLRHLQHICRGISADAVGCASETTRRLLERLHPTPAVCGNPKMTALEFIRENEAFDRGFFSGPFGYLGSDEADILVAIRSTLVSKVRSENRHHTLLSIYAGAGIVPGSTIQSEWTETSHKLNVLSSLFPSSPLSIQTLPNINTAHATAFVEELIRSGITQFYICPGSRSTPLVVAVVKLSKKHGVNVLKVVSTLDERGAGFRAVGYGRRMGRPAVVITSSGSAVGNLYPSVMEAGNDGVPMVLVTADRPYEARGVGANQAVDQVKAFGSTIRYFRDIPPPTSTIPISATLSDANHAVHLSKTLLGPVHLNLQFRENLSPDGGPIRGDNRIDSESRFRAGRYTDVPNFAKWASSGETWQINYGSDEKADEKAVREVVELIATSKRGVIVTGTIRDKGEDGVAASIAHFAETVGFPIFAGVQTGGTTLRTSSAVVPHVEHLLKHPRMKQRMRPDLILQIGAPLISAEVAGMIVSAMKQDDFGGTTTVEDEMYGSSSSHVAAHHVLIHPHYPTERADPGFTATHRVDAMPLPFLKAVLAQLERTTRKMTIGSDLAPLVLAGRALKDAMPGIIHKASAKICQKGFDEEVVNGEMKPEKLSSFQSTLTEPQVILAISEVINETNDEFRKQSLFLSNSMPVRDAEFFLYPKLIPDENNRQNTGFFKNVAVNRGASGIDGVLSSATGFAEASHQRNDGPTTLLIGDLASLHDLNAFHTLTRGEHSSSSSSSSSSPTPLTTIIVNNNGGGIFSFLPIARHGNDVEFDEFFGTPTERFSFRYGAEAFGLKYESASSFEELKQKYREAVRMGRAGVVEAKVVGREDNVEVHKEITRLVTKVVDDFLRFDEINDGNFENTLLPFDEYHLRKEKENSNEVVTISSLDENPSRKEKPKTLLLLHGWMGERADWEETAKELAKRLSPDWRIIACDLPGHGDAPDIQSSPFQAVRSALESSRADAYTEGDDQSHVSPRLENRKDAPSIEDMAKSILFSLEERNIGHVDAMCGYSLGGRVALSMYRICNAENDAEKDSVPISESEKCSRSITRNTKLVLLGANPGNLPDRASHTASNSTDSFPPSPTQDEKHQRRKKDETLSNKMLSISNKSHLLQSSSDSPKSALAWAPFLTKWYGASSIWGNNLQTNDSSNYRNMIQRRINRLSQRGTDMALVLKSCSPSNNPDSDWRYVKNPRNTTLFVAGSLDSKYSEIGKRWESLGVVRYEEVPEVGHALLVEAGGEVARIVSDFLADEGRDERERRDASLSSLSETDAVLDKEEYAIYNRTNGLIRDVGRLETARSKILTVSRQNDVDDGRLGYTTPSVSKPKLLVRPRFLDYEAFAIDVKNDDDDGKRGGVFGIGWGDAANINHDSKMERRRGFVIQILSDCGRLVGVGEVSPLPGLHRETLEEAQEQLDVMREWFRTLSASDIPRFDAEAVLALDGALTSYVNSLADSSGFLETSIALKPSVRSGLEMAILSLASQAYRMPLPQAMAANSSMKRNADVRSSATMLPLNGLVTRGSSSDSMISRRIRIRSSRDRNTDDVEISFPSLKVKVGHASVVEDAERIVQASAVLYDDGIRGRKGKVRADANRAWDHASAMAFASAVTEVGVDVANQLEFIEEPLEKQVDGRDDDDNKDWNIAKQIDALENWHRASGIRYALDESLADLAAVHDYDFVSMLPELRETLGKTNVNGCAAFVLKPALLGMELSFQLAKVARTEFGIGAVFSSSFDSGVGLAYTAILGAISDLSYSSSSKDIEFPHGLGTFRMLAGDTLSPPFGSYVTNEGKLNIASLSRALYGLGLDEMRESLKVESRQEEGPEKEPVILSAQQTNDYQASSWTSNSGREINVQVSLPLPFSDEIASSRFTDLPQQSRWSPWINSVEYIAAEGETEWTINVRGIRFQWRAVSTLLENPRGIAWESVSGLKNRGTAEFIPNSENSCVMSVKMKIITPRIVSSLFRGTSIFVEDFLQNKLLKWSLEMFRDVVKADIALERGDVELGDALFGAVEGRANAIEATLSYQDRDGNLDDK